MTERTPFPMNVYLRDEAELKAFLDAHRPPARFSCYLERDFGKVPCDHDCGKLRCMYPSKPPEPAGSDPEAPAGLSEWAVGPDEHVRAALDTYYGHSKGAYNYSEHLIDRMRSALASSAQAVEKP